MPQVPWPSTGTTSPEGNAVVRMPRGQLVSLVVIPTASPIGTITNANCAKTQASSLSSVSSLHPPDWPIASRVCFQRQFIWIVLFFASWSEVLPHDVVLRRPTIITLASQRSLTNPIVSYFVDLEARHIAHLADTRSFTRSACRDRAVRLHAADNWGPEPSTYQKVPVRPFQKCEQSSGRSNLAGLLLSFPALAALLWSGLYGKAWVSPVPIKTWAAAQFFSDNAIPVVPPGPESDVDRPVVTDHRRTGILPAREIAKWLQE
jgi:hypothetical protein